MSKEKTNYAATRTISVSGVVYRAGQVIEKLRPGQIKSMLHTGYIVSTDGQLPSVTKEQEMIRRIDGLQTENGNLKEEVRVLNELLAEAEKENKVLNELLAEAEKENKDHEEAAKPKNPEATK